MLYLFKLEQLYTRKVAGERNSSQLEYEVHDFPYCSGTKIFGFNFDLYETVFLKQGFCGGILGVNTQFDFGTIFSAQCL